MQTYKVGAECISVFLDQIMCSSLCSIACEMNAHKSKPRGYPERPWDQYPKTKILAVRLAPSSWVSLSKSHNPSLSVPSP